MIPGRLPLRDEQAARSRRAGPRLPVHIAVFAGVNCGELPFVFAGERLDRLGESGSESFYFRGRVLRGARLPQVSSQIKIFHAETIALAQAGFEIFRPRKIVKLRKMTGEFLFVFPGKRYARAIEIGQLTRRKRQWRHRRDWAGNPAVRFFVPHHAASGIGRRPRISRNRNLSILVGAGPPSVDSGFHRAFFQEIQPLGL